MSVVNISNFINGKVDKLIHTHTESEIINQIRSFLFKNYIKTVVENVDEHADGFRMMFIANRFKSKFDNPITKECNGAVFYYSRAAKKFFPLVIPTYLFNSQKLTKSNIHTVYKTGGYDVYPVMDGTIMNLYKFKGEWKISTNKAYDATNLIMFDEKTYMNVLNECLEYEHNSAVKGYLSSLDNVDGGHSVTLCVKNSGFHVFQENFTEFGHRLNNRVTIIHQYHIQDLQTATEIKFDPSSVIYSFSSESFKQSSDKCFSWKELTNQMTSSISSFKKYSNQVGFTPFLGVILRSKTDLGEYSNVLMESNLMSKIRNFLYNFGFSKNLSYKNVLSSTPVNAMEQYSSEIKSYYNMTCVNRLYIFLNRKDVNLFTSIFPHFKKEFAEYNQFFAFLSTFIMKNCSVLEKNLQNLNEIMSGETELLLSKLPEHQNGVSSMDHIYKPSLVKLCMVIVGELSLKKINIPQSHEGWNMLNDFLINTRFLDYYYAFMYKN